MNKMHKIQRGDTIVEVLLAMSVIGLVLGAAFSIANRSVSIGQDAQERTEALKIAETQLEIFRSEYRDNPAVSGRTQLNPFCFDVSQPTLTIVNTDEAPCNLVNGNGQEGLYRIEIRPPADPDTNTTYQFVVLWQRQGTTEDSNVTVFYKPGQL